MASDGALNVASCKLVYIYLPIPFRRPKEVIHLNMLSILVGLLEAKCPGESSGTLLRSYSSVPAC